MSNSLGHGYITLESMFLAYRKAKVDVYYERAQPMAEAFSIYEDNLEVNLKSLLSRINGTNPSWFDDLAFIGGVGLIPKGLQVQKRESQGEPHFSLSDPWQSWSHLLSDSNLKPMVTFRPVSHFTVDMYIICSLWINLVGHRFDACLRNCAKGSRLRRLRNRNIDTNAVGDFHISAPGSFQPYFYCYRDWREKGLRAIEQELDDGHQVVAITMDLTSFYHSIDPRFLLEASYLEHIRFESINGAGLSEDDIKFTDSLIKAFEKWACQIPGFSPGNPTGLPVGPSAPRVIANALLAEFDRLILKDISPVYYGRYVDDIFLVVRNDGNFTGPTSITDYLSRRIEYLKKTHDGLELVLPYALKSKLVFKSVKQRVFVLSGEVGSDLLDTIRSKIDEVSSEWRLLPNLDDLERSPAARVLTAAKDSKEDADSLRKADELSLRRLGFSLLLRGADALARDLPPSEWRTERLRLYRFISRHVITPLRFLDLNDYLPRLVGLAVACGDWVETRRFVARMWKVLNELKSNVQVMDSADVLDTWIIYIKHLYRSLREAVICSFPTNALDRKSREGVLSVLSQLNHWVPQDHRADLSDIFDRISRLALGDWSRIPFKEYVIDNIIIPKSEFSFNSDIVDEGEVFRLNDVKFFLESVQHGGDLLFPLLFPTRPFTPSEITECLPAASRDLPILVKYVRALRGTWISSYFEGLDGNEHSEYITIGSRPKSKD